MVKVMPERKRDEEPKSRSPLTLDFSKENIRKLLCILYMVLVLKYVIYTSYRTIYRIIK